ncbi:MAG: ATPase domain-containing protein [Candidatus Micrarchaeia archaeon]
METGNTLIDAVKRHEQGSVIMVEVPTEAYFGSNADSVRQLVQDGFEGVYVSFQRPYNNVVLLFQQQGIDTKKLVIVDAASACGNEKGKKTGQCVPVSSKMDVDEIVRAIYTSLAALKSKKRFVFIDSITTIALYQPLSETLRFSEFLVRTVKQREGGVSTSTIVFNVAKDLAQKQFIRDVALRADEVITGK